MDNVTHSLVGYALGRALVDERPLPERRAALWTSVLASNAPDVDVVIAPFSEHATLANLLHHRGHTHTLLWAIPIGLACAALFARIFGIRERAARLRLIGLGALAGALHIGFDWLNNYGVHPFYPLDNRWYYGDAVFIIEPLLIAVLASLPAISGLHRATRGGALAIVGVLLALVWLVGQVPLVIAALTTLVIAASLAAQWLARERQRAVGWPSLFAALLVVLMFQATEAQARRALERHLARVHHGEEVLDIVLTPSPGNPLCWSALALTEREDVYRARLGSLTLAPAVVKEKQCRFLPRGSTTAPLATVATRGDVQLRLVFERPLSELRALHERSCEARILMQFARAPFWTESVIGDLRYDNERELGFAEIAPSGACPDLNAPWIAPRTDLLR